MGCFKLSSPLVVLLVAALTILMVMNTGTAAKVVAPSPAPMSHPPPPPALPKAPVLPISKPDGSEAFLSPHNKARAAVGVPPLKWSYKLAKETNKLVRFQREVKECGFADMMSTKFGMNQVRASGMAATPESAVMSWVHEKDFYNYTNNTCAPHHKCGVYKQVVWKRSLEVGCSQVKCPKQHATLTICLYNPHGNVIGEKPF